VRKNLKMPKNFREMSRKSPAKPAALNGRVQIQCKRCFWAHDGPITTSDAIEWSYPQRLMLDDRRPNTFNRAVRRALVSIGAQRVGRAGTQGRPWLWRMPQVVEHQLIQPEK